jgi:diketogulonate reductase-like aldo/keto reductase
MCHDFLKAFPSQKTPPQKKGQVNKEMCIVTKTMNGRHAALCVEHSFKTVHNKLNLRSMILLHIQKAQRFLNILPHASLKFNNY